LVAVLDPSGVALKHSARGWASGLTLSSGSNPMWTNSTPYRFGLCMTGHFSLPHVHRGASQYVATLRRTLLPGDAIISTLAVDGRRHAVPWITALRRACHSHGWAPDSYSRRLPGEPCNACQSELRYIYFRFRAGHYTEQQQDR